MLLLGWWGDMHAILALFTQKHTLGREAMVGITTEGIGSGCFVQTLWAATSLVSTLRIVSLSLHAVLEIRSVETFLLTEIFIMRTPRMDEAVHSQEDGFEYNYTTAQSIFI